MSLVPLEGSVAQIMTFVNGNRQNITNGEQHRRRRNTDLDAKDLELNHWQKFVFPVVLLLIHLCFRWAVFVYLTGKRWVRFLKRTLHFKEEVSLDNIIKASRHLPKKPSHVAFAVQELNLDLGTLADLVVWSIGFGIINISVYDHDGRIKQRSEEFYREIRSRLNLEERRTLMLTWRGHVKEPVTFGVKNCLSLPLASEGDWAAATNVSLLSSADGREDLAAAAQFISSQAKEEKLKVESVDETVIGSLLKSNRGMPDPDLLIRFGLTCCNMGFLPWQIRLTEIYDHSSHKDVNLDDFYSILGKYSRCEQRFGR